MGNDPTSTKYTIFARIQADGVVEKSDIIGAIFGQTEGLLGEGMELRDLQKAARIGRIEVDISQKGGKTSGTIELPSGLEKVETAIIAASLEEIDRIGPAKAEVTVDKIEDSQKDRRERVAKRAQELLARMNQDPTVATSRLVDAVKDSYEVAKVRFYRNTKLHCGPDIDNSDSIIIVEGRNDVLNLLKCGIRNVIAIEGTSVPKVIQDLTRSKTATAFVDGDRGGELILRDMLQTCNLAYVARAPETREVEELPHKMVMKCLQNKQSVNQFTDTMGWDRARGGAPERDAERPERKDRESSERRERPERSQRSEPRSRDDRSDTRNRDDRRDGDRPRRGREERSEEGDKRQDRGGRRERPERKDREGGAPKANNRQAKHDPRAPLRDALLELQGKRLGLVLDSEGKQLVGDIPVRELADRIKAFPKGAQTVVFDGIITSRVLQLAEKQGLTTVVGAKLGRINQLPDTLEIITRDDL